MFDYEYVKNHYRLVAVDLSKQKELDADPKAIQQIELVGQLKNDNNQIVANESMFVLTILEKMKEARLKFSQGRVTVKLQETRVKLTNTQLNKLKSTVKNTTGATLRITKKNFQVEELPHELFLTTRQTTRKKNAFAHNISTNIKLSKVQIYKIFQSGGFLGS